MSHRLHADAPASLRQVLDVPSRRAALILIATVALLVTMRAAAAAESCAEAADRLAADNGVIAGPGLAGSDQAMSGSSMPPATMESRGVEPDARTTAPGAPMRGAAAPPLAEDRQARIAALLAEARQADQAGRRAECEERLRRAQGLLPPG